MPDDREQDISDVSDGAQVVDGVKPPTKKELAEAQDLSLHELQAAISEHVEKVNIHAGNG